ncbi:hypothetical protein FZC84_21160 [Rossellomorea vietnamensis]|uniref:Uncharacterized protein n=1 Tax=Rossellomorea vietnamensis TaxID=218284 RepID=A0A5D4M196_9BACI|nr:hypothetical protein [Rossellomorea vietnamensis]TYR95704.1 hypothetical protein FZC84_21160 [Rossellomorea vietnamensis]
MSNYNLLVKQNGMIFNHFFSTDCDLLDVYKQSLVNNQGYIIWDRGVIDCKEIVGLIKES